MSNHEAFLGFYWLEMSGKIGQRCLSIVNTLIKQYSPHKPILESSGKLRIDNKKRTKFCGSNSR